MITLSAETTRTAASRRSQWLVALVAFAIGMAVGAILLALLRPGVPETTPTPTPTTGSGTGRPTATSAAESSAGAQVNAACLRVIDHAKEVHDILTGVDEATADVDLQRLDDMVRKLQPIEPELGRDLQQCEVDANVGGSPGVSEASPAPTAGEPSATR